MSEIYSANALSTILLITSFILFVLSIKLKTERKEDSKSKSTQNSKTQDIEIKKQG